MAAVGLPGMTIDQMGPWCTARDRVLSAAEAVTVARADLAALRRQAAEAREGLAAVLVPPPEPGETLAALVLRAADWVDGARRAQARRTALAEQRSAAMTALEGLARRLAQSEQALAVWQQDWLRCLSGLHLPVEMGTGAAEGALAILARMDDHLHQMRELHDARIQPMRRDLDAFAANAVALARDLDAELTARPPEEIARVLADRLAQAREDAREHRRLAGEVETARKRAAAEAERLDEARAALAPLLRAADTADYDALRGAIARSDQMRALEGEIRDLKRTLLEGSDGLPRETLEAELDRLDPGAVPGELDAVNRDLEALLEQQRANAAALRTAETGLQRIAGQDDAARAEAERQEALARMGNAVERYLRTYTAARLLRWAIERYREARQGPMLSRAGELFAQLTLRSFERLVVDYDKDPPALHGQRPDGERVSIEGMSDGTRDQLYLALRLAALELHLAQAPAMPFIADDLFINWDDARARAGLAALAGLSQKTQVIFLTHHDHLAPAAEAVFEGRMNIIRLS